MLSQRQSAVQRVICVCVQPVATNGVRYDRQDSPDYLTLNTQIEEAR